MDTSPEYILQCEKAEEIQALCRSLRYKAEHKDSIHAYLDNSGEGWVIVFPYYDNNEWGENDATRRPHYCWLPRQDELQKLMGKPLDILLTSFYDFCGSDYFHTGADFFRETVRIFTSMEQLWLAFVMKEKYRKVWNGIDWEIFDK